MKIVRFKQWFQVKNNEGFTISQFLNRREAESFVSCCTSLPTADTHLGDQGIARKKGITIKRITIYP